MRSSNGATTLPGRYYTSEAIFQEEMEKIFTECWICVGHTSRIPKSGKYFLHNIGHESIIVTRNREGQVKAFYNLCRHRGTRLCTESSGQFSGKIQCPYHAWTYSLDGRLLGAPNMKDVSGFNTADYPLREVAVAVWEGFIFLNLSFSPRSFAEVFGPILYRFTEWKMAELLVADQIVYEIAANWKLIFQNYSECYHCPTVHPLLANLTPYKNSTNHLQHGPFLGGPMQLSEGTESMTMDGRICASPIDTVFGDNLKVVHYYTIFPSMFLTLNPDYVMVHRVEPLAPDRSKIICEFLFAPEAMSKPDFEPQRAVDFWDITNRQDWKVSELSQQGFSSRAYTPGPYANLESLLAAFDREYLQILGHVRESEFAMVQ